jgi:hypothetical protein
VLLPGRQLFGPLLNFAEDRHTLPSQACSSAVTYCDDDSDAKCAFALVIPRELGMSNLPA